MTTRQDIYKYCEVMLGGGMIDVELDPIHYETALNRALAKYRQRSDHSAEESYIFLEFERDQNEYILPQEVIEVRKIVRRSIGARTTGGEGGSLFEPFSAAYTNAYLLSGGQLQGVSTYDFFAQHQELVGRVFGSFIQFVWDSPTRKLTILQRPRTTEKVLLFSYNYRPDNILINDYLAEQWIKDYSLAVCKYILGEARSKFPTIAGPQGGGSLNGSELISQAQTEIEALETALKMQEAGGTGYGVLIG